jgi:hypothetical protein
MNGVRDTMTTMLNSKHVTTAVDLSKSPIFFVFPELITNPTNKVWYPWLCFFIRLWMYSLVWHHASELKSLMDLLPF